MSFDEIVRLGGPLLAALGAAILVDTINGLGLEWPEVSDAQRAENERARAELEAEPD